MATIQELVALTDELVQLAPWWAGWARPISEGEIALFETEHGVALWPGHRAVLVEIGDHAPLPTRPGGALAPLARARALTTASAFVGPLADAFPHSGAAPVELEWDDDRDDYADPHWLRGCLPLTGTGCDESYVLVVSGPDRGRVWGVTPSGAPQLHPTGLAFCAWYRAELERGVARERARHGELTELERRVTRDPEDVEALVELGRAHLFDDRQRAASLLERAWSIGRGDPRAHGLGRAIAQLDLLEDRQDLRDRQDRQDRHDRIAAMADLEDSAEVSWLRSYAAIAAARRGDDAEAVTLFERGKTPAPLCPIAAGYRGLALWRSGQPDRALAALARAPTLANLAMSAKIRGEQGDLDGARRGWARVRLGLTRGSEDAPRAPTLADFITLPAPSLADVDAALARLGVHSG
ncbi:hypothetical protein ENSA5_34250 [Enhygromyxa salina]|uniref:Tetratricopeptide repeat protein n=1 Tax=Enhygromyxa salina TaxID=215803 RepID=A0A2S9XX58_9BACT|nr:hypothetical protein [Enhygromyxa salina]PRP97433.1 hypothetical protein ENSA5_34250 [Enhygromyxa salina]